MRFDLAARVRRLPKPHNGHTALLPILEAISNSFISIEELFGKDAGKKGRITVKMSGAGNRFSCSVTDNGAGMTEENFDAFCMVDTLHGDAKGRKGVGRLLWLAAFKRTDIESTYAVGETPEGSTTFSKRSFQFGLGKSEPITNFVEEALDRLVPPDSLLPLDIPSNETETTISFSGIFPEYARKIPVTKAAKPAQKKLNRKAVEDIICSQFFPYLLNKKMGRLTLEIDGQHTDLSRKVQNSIVRKEEVTTEAEGHPYTLLMMECLAEDAPSSAVGRHNLVYIAGNNRIVKDTDIDTFMGKTEAYENASGQRVKFRSILSSPILDKSVNQERTDFTGDCAGLKGKDVIEMFQDDLREFLQIPLTDLREEQKRIIKNVIRMYPSIQEGSVDDMVESLAAEGYGVGDEKTIFRKFSHKRFIRDKKRNEEISNLISKIDTGNYKPEDILGEIEDIQKATRDEERKSLAEYVTRRRVVLRLLKNAIRYIRQIPEGTDSDYQQENVLHNLICPMRETGVGENKASFAHDLWIVDERLTFSQFVASDVPLRRIVEDTPDSSRPDIAIFQNIFSFSPDDPEKKALSRVLIVEFKRPGRTSYGAEEDPVFQVMDYIDKFKEKKIRTDDGRPVSIPPHCIFNCFIIADSCEKLDKWTRDFVPAPDGMSKFKDLPSASGYNGSIELIGWSRLLDDAEMRNRPFFEKLGISNS